MDSVTKKNTIGASFDLSDHLGGSIFREEEKLAVEVLLSEKDVRAVLATDFGKSITYQSQSFDWLHFKLKFQIHIFKFKKKTSVFSGFCCKTYF